MSMKSGLQWLILIGLALSMLVYHFTNPLLTQAAAVWRVIQVVAVVVVAFAAVRWQPVARLVCRLAGTTYVGGRYAGECRVHENEPGDPQTGLTIKFTIRQSPVRTTIQGRSFKENATVPYSTFDGVAFDVDDDRIRFAMRVSTNEVEFGVLEAIADSRGSLCGNYYSAVADVGEPTAARRSHRVWSWSAQGTPH